MGDYGQQPYLSLDWNIQQLPSYQSLVLANDAPLRNYRKAISRVSKPSSAGNSPHAHPRRRTMTAYNPLNQVAPIQNLVHNSNSSNNTSVQQRRSRPISWHPSVKQQPQPFYVPNCHPSWLRDVSASAIDHQQSGISSMYGLSTPITCPISGDLLSTNDYFASHNESYNYIPSSGPQVYTPVEPSDILYSEPSEWSTFSMDNTPISTYPWMQHGNGFVSSTDPAMDFGHESVASADDLTAPPTPENMASQDCMAYNHNNGQKYTLISSQDDTNGDDLVALGLYDEPATLSLGSALFDGGNFDTCLRTGKGLKLEETFTPSAEVDDDEDGDAENDDD